MKNNPSDYNEFRSNLKDELTKQETGKKEYKCYDVGDIFEYEYSDGKYSEITLTPETPETPESNLVRVLVEVYKDKSKSKKEAQYESLYPWKKR